MPALVIVFRKTIFDGQDRNIVFKYRFFIDGQDGVAVHDFLGMVAPEQVHADTVGHIKFFAVSNFKFR